MADFELVSRRTLSEEQFKLFRYHYVLGADWKLCSRQVGLNRGRFFHEIYRIEEMLGRAFYELEPYALYPTRDYFTVRQTTPMKAMGTAFGASGEGGAELQEASA